MNTNGGASAGSFRILVVDDERDVLEVIVEILEAAGWSVDGFTNGVEALKKAKHTRYDALVLDLYMPDIPGLLLHSKMKFIDRELWTRTVFVSAHFSSEELRRSLEGTPRFVAKPFRAEILIETVGKALPASSRSLSDEVAACRSGDKPVRS